MATSNDFFAIPSPDGQRRRQLSLSDIVTIAWLWAYSGMSLQKAAKAAEVCRSSEGVGLSVLLLKLPSQKWPGHLQNLYRLMSPTFQDKENITAEGFVVETDERLMKQQRRESCK